MIDFESWSCPRASNLTGWMKVPTWNIHDKRSRFGCFFAIWSKCDFRGFYDQNGFSQRKPSLLESPKKNSLSRPKAYDILSYRLCAFRIHAHRWHGAYTHTHTPWHYVYLTVLDLFPVSTCHKRTSKDISPEPSRTCTSGERFPRWILTLRRRSERFRCKNPGVPRGVERVEKGAKSPERRWALVDDICALRCSL